MEKVDLARYTIWIPFRRIPLAIECNIVQFQYVIGMLIVSILSLPQCRHQFPVPLVYNIRNPCPTTKQTLAS